jgi:hypothetical protein
MRSAARTLHRGRVQATAAAGDQRRGGKPGCEHHLAMQSTATAAAAAQAVVRSGVNAATEGPVLGPATKWSADGCEQGEGFEGQKALGGRAEAGRRHGGEGLIPLGKVEAGRRARKPGEPHDRLRDATSPQRDARIEPLKP